MTENNGILLDGTINGDRTTTSAFADDSASSSNNGMTKVAISAFIGAMLGGLAVILTNRDTTEQISRSVRGLGRSVKATAENLTGAIQEAGKSVNSVAVAVNDTSQEVNVAVSSVAANVSSTVKETITTVQKATEGMSETVKTTVDAVNIVKDSVNRSQAAPQTMVDTSADMPTEVLHGNTLYKLIPVGQNPPAK